MRPDQRDVRDMPGHVLFQITQVTLDVVQNLLQPFLAVVIGCFQRDDAEDADPTQPGASQRLLEAGAQLVVGDDDVGRVQASQIESLAGRGADHRILGEILADAGKRGEGISLVDQVAVYLIGYNKNIVLQAYLAEAGQLVSRPNPPHGVVGAAQDSHFQLRVPGLFLKISVIHTIAAVYVNERIGDQLSAVVLNGVEKRVVDGRLDEHFFPWSHEGAHQQVERGHHARRCANPFRSHRPPLASFHPVDDRFVIRTRFGGVAVDPMACPFGQGIHDGLRAGEIHVSHPHRQDPLIAQRKIGLLPMDQVLAFPKELPLNRIGAPATYLCIEIVLHGCSL